MEREEMIVIDEEGHTIPIKVREENGEHIVTVDGVEWVRTRNITHATVLFSMMYEHLTEYMSYSLR